MRTDETAATAAAESEAPAVRKKIGATTYLVRVHFNPDSKETLQAKLERLLADKVRHTDLNSAG